MKSKEEVRVAKKEFSSLYLKFPINGVGISKDEEGYFISVDTERELTAAERDVTQKDKCFPDEFNGVRVKYKTVGRIVAY